jgi:tryptophanyl-tRNA synthetase
VTMSCCLDVQASIFVQSHVQAHSELTWLLSCVTPISWLNKMIQFKEKSRKSVRPTSPHFFHYLISSLC